MQQYLTLEEAAKALAMSPDELREMAKKKTIRAFQDRGSWRFRSQDIQEMARLRGVGSDPELQPADRGKPAPAPAAPKKPADQDLLAVDFALDDSDEVALGKDKQPAPGPRSAAGKSGPRTPGPKAGSDSDVRLVLDSGMDFTIDEDSDVKLEKPAPRHSPTPPGRKKSKLKAGDSGVRLIPPDEASDSDVKLEPSGKDSGVGKPSQSPSDSDIRLQDLPSSGRKKGPDAGIITEEIDLDAEEAKLVEQKPKKQPPVGKHGKSTMMADSPMLPTSSPFELSEPDLNLDAKKGGKTPTPGKKKYDPDSGSDFELIPFDSSKSPLELGSGEIPLLEGDEEVALGSEVSGPNAGQSGINLKNPADSGLSLESGGSDEIEFELSMESGVTPKPVSKKAMDKPAPAPAPEPLSVAQDDSSSEFELSLDDSNADESSSSEFDLSMDDSSTEESSSSEFELSLDEVGGGEEGSDSEFELSLEDSGDSVEVKNEGSDSEFELTLDDEGGLAVEEDAGDIFEETNFDVPALGDESASEAVAIDEGDTDLESGSDFEISLDDDSTPGESSDSQVVALDEDEADDAAATVARPRATASKSKAAAAAALEEEEVVEDDLDLDLDADESGVKPRGKKGKVSPGIAADEDLEEDSDGDLQTVGAPAATDWGPLPAILLFPTIMVMFVVGLMGFELLRGMWGYQRPTMVGKPVIDTIARQFDDSLPK